MLCCLIPDIDRPKSSGSFEDAREIRRKDGEIVYSISSRFNVAPAHPQALLSTFVPSMRGTPVRFSPVTRQFSCCLPSDRLLSRTDRGTLGVEWAQPATDTRGISGRGSAPERSNAMVSVAALPHHLQITIANENRFY